VTTKILLTIFTTLLIVVFLMLAGWTGYIAGTQQFERESRIVRRVDYHGGTLE
jgi:hypothetical protein